MFSLHADRHSEDELAGWPPELETERSLTQRSVFEVVRFAAWETPDSVWSARMYYYMDAPPSGHPNGFEIEEIRWGDRLEKQ
jgi:hypothetical protein